MKIGFIGAASTGKTTVAKKLEKLIPEDRIPSIVRPFMESLGYTEQQVAELPLDHQLKIQLGLMNKKFEQDQKLAHGIFERTPIDHFAYGLLRCYNVIDDELFRTTKAMVTSSIRKYDILFYFPVYGRVPYEFDGFRQVGGAYRQLQDFTIRGLIIQTGITYNVVGSDTTDNRVDIIRNKIDALS